MITAAELHRTAAADRLRFDQAEKDYVILWVLQGLSRPKLAPNRWVFKGGTCLRHCYYPGYRFSEDLDFTCLPDSGNLDAARALLERVVRWVQETSGIRMGMKAPHTIPGDVQVEIPIEYNRAGARTRGLPAVKIHLTFDEPILTEAVTCPIRPRYSDLPEFQIAAYSKAEIVAEKMRALLQQQKKWPRPRDLYDLWFILCRLKEPFDAHQLRRLFIEKCGVRHIHPHMVDLVYDNLKEWNKDAWGNHLKPMMKTVPEFDEVWQEWISAFHELFGSSP